MKKNKLDGMLIATFLTTLFYSSTYPYIHKEIVSNISDNLIALTQIINCAAVIGTGYCWNHFKNLFKFYNTFCVIETIATISTTIFVLLTHSLAAYYLLDTFVYALITRNIVCGGIRLRAVRYKTEEERSVFDNNNNSMSAAATIIGSCIAMVLHLKFEWMMILATVGNIIDNLFYIKIYSNTMGRDK